MTGMSRFVSQLAALLELFLGDWPSSPGAVAVPLIGAAGATFILVSMFAISNGVRDTMTRAGADDVAIVLQRDATLETTSRLSDDELAAISDAMSDATLQVTGRKRTVSAELVQTVDTLSRGGESGAQVLARGLTPSGVKLRKGFRIVEGRMFSPGQYEVVVGRRLARDFAGLALGTTLTGAVQEWSIVGVFEEGGGAGESESFFPYQEAEHESRSTEN